MSPPTQLSIFTKRFFHLCRNQQQSTHHVEYHRDHKNFVIWSYFSVVHQWCFCLFFFEGISSAGDDLVVGISVGAFFWIVNSTMVFEHIERMEEKIMRIDEIWRGVSMHHGECWNWSCGAFNKMTGSDDQWPVLLMWMTLPRERKKGGYDLGEGRYQ